MSRLNWDLGPPVGDVSVAPLAVRGGFELPILVSRRLGMGLAMVCRGGAGSRCPSAARLL